jgi:hypothetical protein
MSGPSFFEQMGYGNQDLDESQSQWGTGANAMRIGHFKQCIVTFTVIPAQE